MTKKRKRVRKKRKPPSKTNRDAPAAVRAIKWKKKSRPNRRKNVNKSGKTTKKSKVSGVLPENEHIDNSDFEYDSETDGEGQVSLHRPLERHRLLRTAALSRQRTALTTAYVSMGAVFVPQDTPASVVQ